MVTFFFSENHIQVNPEGKLTELLRKALNDVRHLPDGYEYDYGYFWFPNRGVCSVCLAGSQLIGVLDKQYTFLQYNKSEQASNWLYALSDFAGGHYTGMLNVLGIAPIASLPVEHVNDEMGSDTWFANREAAIKILEEAGY